MRASEPRGGDTAANDALSAARILGRLSTTFVGHTLAYWPEVGSTNDEARRLAEAGAPDGTLVITDHQRTGRGRLGRRWEAPPQSCLLLSLLFRPELAPQQAQWLTMISGLAAAESIEAQTGLGVGLKWPNDVLVGGKKAGGILTEIELGGDRIAYAVVGIGLNVNLDPARLPGGLLSPATSLSHELGRSVDRLELLWALLGRVEAHYLALKAGRSPHAEWAQRLATLGQAVVVSGAGAALQGVAEGVDAQGALLVRLADGSLERIVAGDVTLRPPAAASPA